MSVLRRIVMVRHGETEGQSSVRFHGSADVRLNDEGRAQLREAARKMKTEVFDLVASSPLQRAWEGARIVSGGAPVRLYPEFREVHFGHWEGLTAEEIEASDPVLYRDWQAGAAGFEYPGGELREAFRARVASGLDALLASGAKSVLLVSHKGVIRTIGERLLDGPLSEGPELGGIVSVSRGADGRWHEGRRGSNPPGLEE
ncbi:MAG: histidine phosphatase family protein [Deltaproteobacteria bacterium]|jgi:broad specificity phosphatase PhoE|nr:histidine phosphatase family protein [Deltaproteobacteria bacterium]MBW2541733.1 histidine phosphatase family protein [Deltaproteobacteria bacterium]